jgi:hypothetical protein
MVFNIHKHSEWLGIIDQHYVLIIIPLFITQPPTCFGTYVPSSGSVLYTCELLENSKWLCHRDGPLYCKCWWPVCSESVYQVARRWVEVGSFHTRLFGVVYVTCGDFNDGSEKRTASSPSSFWRDRYGSHPHPRTTLIWHLVISSYLQKWNWSWKDAGLITLSRSRRKSQTVLDTVTENDFQKAFQKQRRRWDRCLHAGGNYFQGDGVR